MKKTALFCAFLLWAATSAAQDLHIVLWDNATASTGSNGLTGPEQNPQTRRWDNTQTAEMWIYKAGDNATGQAVLFFPGGGYGWLSMPNGHKEAQWFARQGITAAVVKYRLPNGHPEIPLADAEEALRTMRAMAAELGIDPAQVGVSGTSAGGHLAACVGTMAREKPGFMILFYPVISSDDGLRNDETYGHLVGEGNLRSALADRYSPEKRIDATTPPALIFHCDDDPLVAAANASVFYTKMKEHGHKASLHIYPSGGHGWGMSEKFRYRDDWRRSVADWLQTLREE